MFVGVGAKRIRDLFTEAKETAPCIIFIDEFDALAGKRAPLESSYHRQTVNQLLSEMDGFYSREGVIVIAATNLLSSIDTAAVRPGRFDKIIDIPLPDVKGRKKIIELYLKNYGPSIIVSEFASRTIGFTGADLNKLVNQAKILASLDDATEILYKHMSTALDEIQIGLKSSRLLMEDDKKIVAYHESGHALVALNTPNAKEINKATIMPRGMAAGYVSLTPKEEILTNKSQLLADIDVSMGGRTAETLIFGEEKITSGASNDFEVATNIAFNMVTKYGMCSDVLGPLTLSKKEFEKSSPELKFVVESQVKKILTESETRVHKLLTRHSNDLDLLAGALMKYETLTLDEIKTVLRGESIDINV